MGGRSNRLRGVTVTAAVALAGVIFLWATSYHRFLFRSHAGRVHLMLVRDDRGVDTWLRRKPFTAHELTWFRSLSGATRIAGVEVGPSSMRLHGYTYFLGSQNVSATVTLRYRVISVPYWLLAGVATAPLVIGLLAMRRVRTRRTTGRCEECGYDLRATPGRCPECGTTPKVTAA